MSYALRRGTRANDTLVADNVRSRLSTTTRSETGSLVVEKDTSVGGNLSVSGNTAIGGGIDISGSVAIDGSIDVGGGLSVFGSETIGGSLDVGGDLGVSGDATFDASVNILGDLSVNGDATFDASVNILGDLSVNGDATFDASMNILGDLSVNGNGDFGGDVVIHGDLTVIKESTLSETTYIHNDIFYTVAQTVEEPSTFFKTVTICGELDVSGDVSFNTIICHDQLRFPNKQIRITEDTTPFVNQADDTIAIGRRAGVDNQGTESVAIGHLAGNTSQGAESVALGHQAGQTSQGEGSVALGYYAGANNQSNYAVAIGRVAAQANQGEGAVAIGNAAGDVSQGEFSVGVGYFSGYRNQGKEAVAVGHDAGRTNQGDYSVAVGYRAGLSGQVDNSIILNATGSGVNTTVSGFIVKPVREQENLSGWIPPGTLWYDTSSGEIASQPDISQGTIEVDLTISGDLRVDGSFNIGPASIAMWEDTSGGLVMKHSKTPTNGLNIYMKDASNTTIDSGDATRGLFLKARDVSSSAIHISETGKVGIGKRIEGNGNAYRTLDISGDVEVDGALFIHGSEIGISGVDTAHISSQSLELYNLSDSDAVVFKLTPFVHNYGNGDKYERIDADLTHGTISGGTWVELSGTVDEHTIINHSTITPTMHARIPPNHAWYGTKLHHVNYDLMCDTAALDTSSQSSYGNAGRDFGNPPSESDKYASFDVVLPTWLDASDKYAFPEGTRVCLYGKGLSQGPDGQRTFLRLIVPGYASEGNIPEEGIIHLNFAQISPDVSYGLARYRDEEDPGIGASSLTRTEDSTNAWFDLTSVPSMQNLDVKAWMRDGNNPNNYPNYADGSVSEFNEDNTKCIWKCECVATTHGWIIDRFTITNGDGNTTVPQNLVVRKNTLLNGDLSVDSSANIRGNLGVSGDVNLTGRTTINENSILMLAPANGYNDISTGADGSLIPNEIRGTIPSPNEQDWGYLRLSAGGDICGGASRSYIDLLGFNVVEPSDQIRLGTEAQERMRITNNGIGIGTETPTALLDVNGNARVVSDVTVGGNLSLSGGNITVYEGNTGNIIYGKTHFLTGGANDMYWGWKDPDTDEEGYMLNANVGGGNDDGWVIKGKTGTGTSFEDIGGFISTKGIGGGIPAGRKGIYSEDLMVCKELIKTSDISTPNPSNPVNTTLVPNLNDIIKYITPVGTIKMYAGNAISTHTVHGYSNAIINNNTSWMVCDGSAFNGADWFQELNAALGGSILPDLRGKTVFGDEAGYTATYKNAGGSKTISVAQMPSHSHRGSTELGGSSTETTSTAGNHIHNTNSDSNWKLARYNTNTHIGGVLVDDTNGEPSQYNNGKTLSIGEAGEHQHTVTLPDHLHTFTTDSAGSGANYIPPHFAAKYIIFTGVFIDY